MELLSKINFKLDKKIGEVVNYMKQFKKFKKILDKSKDGVIDIDDL